ncbi:MAG: NADH-quinone oxidoreductase subunit J [Aestuariivirga sp.]|uniref:complex I subunit 5 family protein n=1 Tax=Aestuariivirga sp. TaxID=2650926 RepID=UPI0025C5691F|nr:proton-conducting transporter membrane subunit [Aestuariivirga sp.]MCA3561458.1 NADH-quinone oxidoreductase subunit J [Aestuariivirga sp.]
MMPLQALAVTETTPGGALLVLGIVMTAVALVGLIGLGGRGARAIVIAALLFQLYVSVRVALMVAGTQSPLAYVVGGFHPPLGITLRADGISALMMVVSAAIFLGAAAFAWKDFAQPKGKPESRASLIFWTALLAMASALNLLFTSSDLFNLYVGIELLTFAAIPVAAIKGGADTLRAALRYLLFAVFGSMLYLFGIVLLYGAYGTLDISGLAAQLQPNAATLTAAGFVTVGLLAKTALFPFHLWLPPAHAGAPAAGSAVLSALVVKGSLFLLMRLWFDTFPTLREPADMQLLALFGALAVIVGSITALRQQRLKLLVAYSTVAQIGYMFFVFTLAPKDAGALIAETAWTGAWTQVVAHAFAKAGMFLAAGLAAEVLGHDRIRDLGGLSSRAPLVVLAFALSGLSLMGLPPSGGFNAKFMLLVAALAEGHWAWGAVIIAGGMLAGAYVFGVLARMMAEPAAGASLKAVGHGRQWIALGLSAVAVLMGLLPLEPIAFLAIGRAL